MPRLWLFLLLFSACCLRAQEPQNYAQQVFFDNSLSPGSYFYSSGSVSAPSTLQLADGKIPTESQTYVSGPNALEISYSSKPAGGWVAEIDLYNYRDRNVDFTGRNLFLSIYPTAAITPDALPHISLHATDGGDTAPLPLSQFVREITPGKWTRVRIPFASFASTSVRQFDPRRLGGIVFSQGRADSAEHTLYLDDIRIEDDLPATEATPSTPRLIEAKGFERHVDLRWDATSDPKVSQYVIYRSLNGGPARAIGVQRAGVYRFADYIGDPNASARYEVSARTPTLKESPLSNTLSAHTHPMSDDDLLSMVQEASIRFYWEGAQPNSGMSRESSPGDDRLIALGASGFGTMALIVGAEQGFIPREQVVQRMLRITNFLSKADRFHGVWPHFLDDRTGHAVNAFQIYDNAGDLVETSFLMQGLLTARQYFNRNTPNEERLRNNVTELWRGIDWDSYRATPKRDALYWHWSPDYAFHIANRLQGWNETMITYMLPIASPTHPSPASIYEAGYCRSGKEYGGTHNYLGITMPMFYTEDSPGPLFFTHYSYLGYDPRGWRDRYANYFESNRSEALVSQAYSIANPKHRKGYGANSWGLTAVDGPRGYEEYKPFDTDDGTVAPTGAISSYAYAPAQSLLVIKHYYRDLDAQLWDIYGFRDSINEEQNWYSGITMGLNQAPQAVMIENGRTGLVWRNFMANPEIRQMQQAIGLVPDSAAH